MHLFIDTEFTNLTQPKPGLLAFGAVTEDGRELYVELDLRTRIGAKLKAAASTFVRDTVLPQFRRRAPDITLPNLVGARIADWLLALRAERIKVIYDYYKDFELMERALRDANRLGELTAMLQPTTVSNLLEEPDFEAAREASWTESRASEGLERHHALADARALRAGFKAFHGQFGQ